MPELSSNYQLTFTGTLKGHKGWVTSIATPADPTKNFIVSGSRDKTAIIWHLTRERDNFGIPKKSLHGHNHFIQDVTLSADGKFAITASWDRTMRLWDLESGKTQCRFVGHTGDVMSVSFSPDNRLIVSGSRDKSIKIWNTRGELKGDFATPANNARGASNLSHTDWITDVCFSPEHTQPLIVSASNDRMVKVWDLKGPQAHLNVNHIGHTGTINTVAISPDGTLCASAGKDCTVMLWDLINPKHIYSLEAGDAINALVFSPNRYWLCAATSSSIKIWDLHSKTIVDDLRPEFPSLSGRKPECICLAWSADGTTLFCGYTDNNIRVWQVTQKAFAPVA